MGKGNRKVDSGVKNANDEMSNVTRPILSAGDVRTEARQLQYWFEQACHIMVLDPEMNPMGLPILKYLNETPSLLHAIQSLSAAHENYYRSQSMEESLLERQAALSLFQQELHSSRRPPVSAFLTVYTLGISSPWIENCMGKEHLAGGRAMIEIMLASDGLKDELSQFVFGAFIYWDMACSFLLDPQEQQPLNTPQIFNAIQSLGDTYHCIAGYAIEMFYLIGTLGRYCRGVIDSQGRDLVLEATLEEQMISWTPRQDSPMLYSMADAFRKHARIMLYRICHRRVISACSHVDQAADCTDETEHTISRYASDIVHSLGQMPITNPYLNLQSIPLMTAGSELGMEKVELRNEVKQRFKAIYSLNRIPANLRAIELLEELWTLRAAGIKMSWVALLLQKNCLHKFTLG
ncbi:hypothetical protein CGCF415_v005111 [Colletotrichum fructicola]|uniref:C6 zinc finger domain-containing protein n=2 Tax=Colletotrichum fructicola (strain Nara gc5) TaxID=1213859 RepID=L2FWH8_COLFN|nr:uncharacterized protein CGMCC3_g8954 [Colletotrichum fructicola]KAE9575048.1 hypothetical protein CGMCC3_g8954 [Colletotrichum fructicola]KAF4893948.1 hypothetical protein CGCFRS4_v006841 [Colletotrichum fructicola]KAF4910615.1 hypothetical protein CGCF415_v005111 [Colletotrichum fructicola]KAF4938950.1 hypothetical protein CGCF245_v004083 [Colletotrichum fructicola]